MIFHVKVLDKLSYMNYNKSVTRFNKFVIINEIILKDCYENEKDRIYTREVRDEETCETVDGLHGSGDDLVADSQRDCNGFLR